MSRTTATIATVQGLLVFLGFFAVRIVLKVSGYPDTLLVRWNPLALVLRAHGFWLLLVPALWIVFASFSERIERGIFSSRVAYVAGFLFTGAIAATFLDAACHPFTHPILIHTR